MKTQIYLPLTLLVLLAGVWGGYRWLHPVAVTDDELKTLIYSEEDLIYGVNLLRYQTKREMERAMANTEKQGNSPKDLAVLKRMEDLRKATDELFKVLYKPTELLQAQLMPKDYEYEKDEAIRLDKCLAAMKKVSAAPAQKEAQQLYTQIKTYQELIKKETGLTDSLTLTDANRQPLTAAEFEDLYFNTHSILVLNNLRRIGVNVAELEYKAIQHLAKQVGGVFIKFDQIKAFITAESDEIYEGEPFRAKMFLVATASNIKPRMAVSEGEVTVGEDGIGRVRFKVPDLPDNAFDKNGLAKREWQGSITIKKADGNDTTFKFRETYFIRKQDK
jgi:hypothetical protein